jgi:hypothetical protein
MGHRKKLVSHIKMLKHGLDGAYATNTDDGSSEGSTSGFTRTGGSSACGSASSGGGKSSASTKGRSESSGKINFKCYVGDDISVLHLSANVSYSQLKSKLRKEYGAKMIVQYKDLDGDKIRIKKTSHLKAAIDECKGTGVVKLYLRGTFASCLSDLGAAQELAIDWCGVVWCGVLLGSQNARRR